MPSRRRWPAVTLFDCSPRARTRLPLAAAALDLPRGRKRRGWKRDFLAAVREAAGDLEGLSEKQLANTIRAHRRERGKAGLTVVAEAAKASA
jgi:hypothetical protein